MRINVLHKGDEVVFISGEILAVKRKNGEVDIIPFIYEDGCIRLNMENIITVGYGDNTITCTNDNGVEVTVF